LQIWKRILNNIVWLYKKKGTRDAIMFIFDLIGAPECLVNLNEFVYDIQKYIAIQQLGSNPVSSSQFNGIGQASFVTHSRNITPATAPFSGTTASFSPVLPMTFAVGNVGALNPLASTGQTTIQSNKINSHGYINYGVSEFDFQEGGPGRGNGQAYINQWRPEFDLIKREDNVKTQTGDPAYYGTENIVNTKELEINFDPAKAIECDVKQFYEQSGSCVSTSATTVPLYYVPDCSVVQPTNISEMTLTEYLKYVFTNGVNPRTRKVSGLPHTSSHYAEMKKAYMNYYYSSTPENSHLTIGSMEAYMELLEVNLHTYMLQLLPATTIFNTQGTVYRNPLFHRQKFVYKEGINDGSEFQASLPVQLTSAQTPIKLESQLPLIYGSDIEVVHIHGSVCQTIAVSIGVVQTITSVNENIVSTNVPSFDVSTTIRTTNTIVTAGFSASRRY